MSAFNAYTAPIPDRSLRRATVKCARSISTLNYAAPGADNMNTRRPGDRLEAIYLEIETESGASGLWGPIEEWQAFPIWKTLRPFLLGRDALASELLFDQMARLDRHGRSGMYMTAISAMDCALWDLKGKVLEPAGLPALGRADAAAVPAYASMLGYSVTAGRGRRELPGDQGAGLLRAQKWFFRYGPADGEAGKRENLAMAQAVRTAVGPDYKLMFDAFMGWDLNLCHRYGAGTGAVNPVWLEEPVPPERVGAFRKIRPYPPCRSPPVSTSTPAGRRVSCWSTMRSIFCRTIPTGPVGSASW